MSDLINTLVTALKQHSPDKKPVVGKMAELADVEKVTGEDVNAAWKIYQTSLTANTNKNKKDAVKGIFIKTKRGIKSFRRAGFSFNETGFGIALAALSKDQLTLLKNERQLIIDACTFTNNDTYLAE